MPTDLTGTPTSLGIGTYNVDADAPSGLGFNAAMAQIDALIAARATLASPTFTGTPTAPTPTPGDVSTKIATTSFVSNAIANLASKSSASVQLFTGNLSTGPSSSTLSGSQTAGIILQTDGFQANLRSSASFIFGSALTTDTQWRFLLDTSGVLNWGPGGSTATDTSLSRSGVGTLTLAGSLIVNSNLAGASSILSAHPTAGVGYSTGAGGSVTQLTNRTTAVTLNKIVGRVVTNNANLASGASVTFTVNNSAVASTDSIVLSALGPSGRYYVSNVGAGSFDITYLNDGVGNFISTITFNFAVIKGVTS